MRIAVWVSATIMVLIWGFVTVPRVLEARHAQLMERV